MKYEKRLTATEFEYRSVGNTFEVEGYAAKWNTRSQDLGGFTETIAEYAARDSLAAGVDTRALFNHEPSKILGRRSAGTLDVSEDSTGIPYRIKMPNTTYARDLIESIERKDVNQSSFGFRTTNDDWVEEGRSLVRTLVSFDLLDVSPVTYPAYLDTYSGVGARSLSPSAVLAEYEARRAAGPAVEAVRFVAPEIEDIDALALRARILGSRF